MIGLEATFAAAVIVGLLGSSHCLGMCGGIVSALNLGLDGRPGHGGWRLMACHVGYNSGRIASYVLIGLLAGGLGGELAQPGIPAEVGKLIAAAFMVALGLYLADWWRGLAILERGGAILWRRIQPLAARLLPVKNPAQAMLLGALWGWLPCGLVYAVLAWSLTTGSATEGALVMAGFGLGTLPALLVAGNAFQLFRGWVRSPRVRATAGSLLVAFGLYSAYAGLAGGKARTHDHAAHSAALSGFSSPASATPAIRHSVPWSRISTSRRLTLSTPLS